MISACEWKTGTVDQPGPQRPSWCYGDDSLCHGWAGLVHTTVRAAADAGPDSELARVVPRLQRRWRQRSTHARPQLSDPDGMLEGSTGIALARHSIEHAGPPAGWDACLLTTSPNQKNPHREGTG
jgi:hypothetical protein